MQSFRSRWNSSINEALEKKKNRFGMIAGYPGIVHEKNERGGLYVNWEKLWMPHGPAESYLEYAIEIGCIFYGHEYYLLFLSWANETANKALSDERFNIDPEAEPPPRGEAGKKTRGWKTEGTFPGNHGKTVAAACFARALRDNSGIDNESLLLAADEIAESAIDGGMKFWDHIAQSEYLRSVRLSLIAGDVGKAEGFFKRNHRKFNFTHSHEQWLKRLIEDIQAADDRPLSGEAEQHFQRFFDQVRDPDAKLPSNQSDGTDLFANISILRLELAIIKQRYVLKQPIAGNWTSILRFISE